MIKNSRCKSRIPICTLSYTLIYFAIIFRNISFSFTCEVGVPGTDMNKIILTATLDPPISKFYPHQYTIIVNKNIKNLSS